MRTFLTPRWILSHLFVVGMIVLMTSLGLWQLQRLDDRKTHNALVREAAAAEPAPIGELLDRATPPLDHTATTVSGTYVEDRSFLVANRTFDSRAGSWLATPLQLGDGRVVVVVRGWVPRLWIAAGDTRDVAVPRGEVQVLGRAFASVGGGRIGSGTDDYAEVNRVDLDTVSQVTGLDVADLWVQLESQSPEAGELPLPVPPPTLNDGPHLSYAFQWFFFSVGTVVAYFLILRRRQREDETEAAAVAVSAG